MTDPAINAPSGATSAGAASPAAPVAEAPVQARATPRNQWWDVWDQFRTHRGALLGLACFLLIVVMVVLGPLLWRLDATFIDIRAKNTRHIVACFGLGLGRDHQLLPEPGRGGGPQGQLAHPLGTDQLGRDILARMISGGQVSLAVGMTAMALALIVGTGIGVLAGYFKRLDGLLMRFTDLFLALPTAPASAGHHHAVPRSPARRIWPG